MIKIIKKIKKTKKITNDSNINTDYIYNSKENNKNYENENEKDKDDELYDLFTSDRTDQFEKDIIKSRRLFLNAKVKIKLN